MPTVRLPIEDDVEMNANTGASSSHVWVRTNLLPMKNGQQVVRPGVASYSINYGSNNPVQIRAYQRNTSSTLVNWLGVANLNTAVFVLTWDGSTVASATLTGSLGADHAYYPFSFCQDGYRFVVAKGSSLAYGLLTGGTITTPTGSGNHPRYNSADAKINKVLAFDNYFLATRVAGPEFYWTDAGTGGNPDPALWPALNFAQAFNGEEPIMDAHILGNQIVFIGTKSIEVWENDGVNPFSPTPGGKYGFGGMSIAGLSTIVDNSIYLVDTDWRLIKYTAGSIETIENPFAKSLSDADTPYYGEVTCLTLYGEKFIVINVAWVGIYVYGIDSKKWSNWTNWSEASESYLQVVSFAQLGANYRYKNVIVCGTAGGYVSKFQENQVADVIGGSGTSGVYGRLFLRAIDNSTGARKRTRELRARVVSASAGSFDIKYKEVATNDAPWSAIKSFTLGNTTPGVGTSKSNFIKLPRLGTYKSRHYQFSINGVSAAFSDIEEDLEVLR